MLIEQAGPEYVGACIDSGNPLWVGEDPLVTAENCHEGIQVIDRTTVRDLGDIVESYQSVQHQLDKADAGLNPLGMSQDTVAFDIDPVLVRNVFDAKTHFEQIYDRAAAAQKNAVDVFNHVNQQSQSLRRNQDSLVDFSRNIDVQERDFKHRLIEIFGYPFDGDIGPGGDYAAGYDGPDLIHFMWLDPNELNALQVPVADSDLQRVSVNLTMPSSDSFGTALTTDGLDTFLNKIFSELDDPPDDNTTDLPSKSYLTMTANYKISRDGYGIILDEDKGQRRAIGEIQRKLAAFYQARAAYEKSVMEYELAIEDINSQAADLYNLYGLHWSEIRIKRAEQDETESFNWWLGGLHTVAQALKTWADNMNTMLGAGSECFPRVAGFSFDLGSLPHCAGRLAGVWTKIGLDTVADILFTAEYNVSLAKEMVGYSKGIELEAASNLFGEKMMLSDLETLIRKEPTMRLQAFMLKDQAMQARAEYLATLARGQRILDTMLAVRKKVVSTDVP